jgi:hypothetical protein
MEQAADELDRLRAEVEALRADALDCAAAITRPANARVQPLP